jgi:hypothetical protein
LLRQRATLTDGQAADVPGSLLPTWQTLSHVHEIFSGCNQPQSNTITRLDALYIASSVGSMP